MVRVFFMARKRNESFDDRGVLRSVRKEELDRAWYELKITLGGGQLLIYLDEYEAKALLENLRRMLGGRSG